jgi:WD40 repeat protein
MSVQRLLVCLLAYPAAVAAAWSAGPPAARYSSGEPLPRGALARLGSVRFRHSSRVRIVAVAPSGKLAASAAGHPDISLWNLPTGHRRGLLRGHERNIVFLAFSPDGTTLASSDADAGPGKVILWDALRGRVRHVIAVPAGVSRLAFTPDSRAVAGAVSGKGVLLWEAATGKQIHSWIDPLCHGACAFAAVGNRLAFARKGGDIAFWDLEKTEQERLLTGDGKTVLDLEFSPDGKRLLARGSDGVGRIWDVASASEGPPFDAGEGASPTVHFIDRGRGLLAVTEGRYVRGLDLGTGKDTLLWEEQHAISSIAFSADTRLAVLATINEPERLRLLDLVRKREVPPAPGAGHDAYLASLAFSPDGKRVATASFLRGDQAVRIWDSRSGRLLRALGGHHGGASAVAFSPNGKWLASAARGPDRTIRLWNVATGQPVRMFEGHQAWPCSLAFSPDGRMLASGDGHESPRGDSLGTARLWDVRSGKHLLALVGHGSAVRTLAFSPDSRALVTVADRARLVDLGSRKVSWAVDARSVAAISSDGRLVACRVGAAGEVGVREVLTGRLLWQRRTPAVRTMGLAFSPDGELLATGGLEDSAVHLWGALDGKEVRAFSGHSRAGVSALAFAPDGATLASGGIDATALVWDLRDLPKRPARPRPGELASAWIDLGSDEPARAYRAIRLLATDPLRAVPYLGKRVRPVPHDEPKRLSRLVADLDGDEFATREKASAALARAGRSAEPYLRAALKSTPSAEQQKRIVELLRKLAIYGFTEDERRAFRAVAVLERIGSDAARTILLRLAGGAPAFRLTQDANASLRRLLR